MLVVVVVVAIYSTLCNRVFGVRTWHEMLDVLILAGETHVVRRLTTALGQLLNT